jgi:hypothetical protein
VIITTYNQPVRLLSSEPFGWFASPKFTRAWEPTLLWNHCTHLTWGRSLECRIESSGSLSPAANGNRHEPCSATIICLASSIQSLLSHSWIFVSSKRDASIRDRCFATGESTNKKKTWIVTRDGVFCPTPVNRGLAGSDFDPAGDTLREPLRRRESLQLKSRRFRRKSSRETFCALLSRVGFCFFESQSARSKW